MSFSIMIQLIWESVKKKLFFFESIQNIKIFNDLNLFTMIKIADILQFFEYFVYYVSVFFILYILFKLSFGTYETLFCR